MFTGKRPKIELDFLDPESLCPEEILCFLDIIYTLAHTAYSADCSKTSFEQIRQQLAYIRYGSGTGKAKGSIFLYVRNRCGHTQQTMADMLGIDIKKLRQLEKGRLMPDSEIVWKMYDLFRISPAFILKDPKGLLNELSHVLGLMKENDREVVLHILENGHKLYKPALPAAEQPVI